MVREKHTQARNSERSEGARDIVDTDTPRMTAEKLINETFECLLTLPTRRATVLPK
jgi:hypothetical protein